MLGGGFTIGFDLSKVARFFLSSGGQGNHSNPSLLSKMPCVATPAFAYAYAKKAYVALPYAVARTPINQSSFLGAL